MNKKKRYILIMIFSIIAVMITGTFAWLSYRSSDTAMVLTVGDINNVRITLYPYRVKQKIKPSLTYKSENDEENIYTNIEGINNSSSPKKVELYYKVNKIDSELISNDFKYTIEKSTNGTTFEQYYTGDFSELTNKKIIIKEEILPANTTYLYKVYVWLESDGNQSEIQGKSFDGELRAEFSDASYDFAYTGDYQEYTAPMDGYYFVETWGPQGGNANGAVGGKGAYTAGTVYLTQNERLYVYVGGKGVSTSSGVASNLDGGYNGGGATGGQDCCGRIFGSGGGATDIRLVSGAWNDATSLNSRIMVAGGGGGAYSGTDVSYVADAGGDGGGLFGLNGQNITPTSGNTYCYGQGGSQTSGGRITTDCNYSSSYKNEITGGFGYGGGGYGNYTGGGGGYYGGSRSGHIASAGGGSSFISGYAGVNAIDSTRTHTNNTRHYSNKYFIDNTMIAGVNSGNGKAKITYVGDAPERVNTDLNNVRYIKDCINGSSVDNDNHWVELQAIKNGVNIAKGISITGITNTSAMIAKITDGDITSSQLAHGEVYTGNQCIILDLGQTHDLDEIAIWHYWADGRTYNDNITYVSSDGTDWIEVIHKTEAETSNGKRTDVWNISVPTYSINYNVNGGSGTIDYTTYTYAENGTVNLSSTIPTRAGYTFKGWSTSSTATSATYSAGGAFSRNKKEDITLYAVWEANAYAVSFNANGGSGGQSANVIATYDAAMPSISTTKPTRNGWTFQGWYDNATYTSGTQYYTAAGASARTYNKTSGTTLYAGWKDTTAPTINAVTSLYMCNTTINASTASAKIYNLGSDGQSGLSQLQYYTTVSSGSATGSSSSPKTATVSNNAATLSFSVGKSPVLHIRLKDNAGNFSSWLTINNWASYLTFAQVYNKVLYTSNECWSLDNNNIIAWVNRSGTTRNKVYGAIHDSERGVQLINNTASDAYTTLLYRGILGREPDSGGLANFRSYANGNKVAALLDSAEGTNIRTVWGLP